MLTFETVIPASQSGAPPLAADEVLPLPHALRERSRQRVTLLSGREAGLILPRGTLLRHGDLLRSAEGVVVRVEAAGEHLSVVRFPEARNRPRDLARAALHLGNRHAPVQIGPDFLAYAEDPVLDELMGKLGFAVEHRTAPFEPEPGAIPLPHIEVGAVRRAGYAR
jgi:urease accessory protein